MKLIKEIRENVAILTLKGDFDSFVCQPFIDQVNAIHKEGIHNFVVDLRLILFINSTGIGTLIKVHKEAQKENGNVVLCRPSKFVTGVLETLGLHSLFKVYDDPDAAVKELGGTGDGADLGGDSSVIVHIGKTKIVGKMASLEEDGMAIVVPEAGDELAAGAEIKVKFRLPLFMKSHYFDAVAEVAETVHTTQGVKLSCAFKSMADDDRVSISQFVKEMKFLRQEARKEG